MIPESPGSVDIGIMSNTKVSPKWAIAPDIGACCD
jgi:hypothetical protein